MGTYYVGLLRNEEETDRQNQLSGTSVWRPQSRYTVSRIECRIKFPQNQRCRAKIALHPPISRCRTFLRTPLSHIPLIHSRQGGAAGWWRVSRHFWVPKTDRATGGCRSYSHTRSFYSVQLSKPGDQENLKIPRQRRSELCFQ